jgi:hypothetical protein
LRFVVQGLWFVDEVPERQRRWGSRGKTEVYIEVEYKALDGEGSNQQEGKTPIYAPGTPCLAICQGHSSGALRKETEHKRIQKTTQRYHHYHARLISVSNMETAKSEVVTTAFKPCRHSYVLR